MRATWWLGYSSSTTSKPARELCSRTLREGAQRELFYLMVQLALVVGRSRHRGVLSARVEIRRWTGGAVMPVAYPGRFEVAFDEPIRDLDTDLARE